MYLPDCCSMGFTTLLNYYLIDQLCNVNFFVSLLDDLILGFCYSNLTRKAGRFERASTITIVFQADKLITCASHPKHDEAELLLFENYSLSLWTFSSKNNRRYSEKCAKNKFICFIKITWLMAMKMRLKMKTTSYRYDINRLKSWYRHYILNIKWSYHDNGYMY